MKTYKIKEALANLKVTMDYIKVSLEEMGEKFEMLTEILEEKEEDDASECLSEKL